MDVAEEKLKNDVAETTVELVSSDGIANATGNGTAGLPNQDQLDFEKMIDDWKHLRNLPSFKTAYFFVASAIHMLIDTISARSEPSINASKKVRDHTTIILGLPLLEYTFWSVIDTLATVEAPQVTVPARAPWSSKKDDGDEAPRVEIKEERQVTGSLRTTVRHLYKVGGATAFVRGIACYVCLSLAGGAFIMAPAMFLGIVVENPRAQWDETISSRLLPDLREFAVECVLVLLFASWDTCWVHIMITQPTLRIWYRRLPPFFATLRATWRPLLLNSLTSFVIWKVLPRPLRWAAGFYMSSYKPAEGLITSDNILRSIFWVIVHAAHILVFLPVHMATTRVQASLLPEEEETIVPMDRTFGTSGTNGLRPGLLAESRGALSFKEAWRSVTWAELRRVVIIRAKFIAIQVAISAAFWVVGGKDALPDKWIPWKYTS
ncbi:hypothetical protein Q7P37_004105 [Cladosporium fusiforme]